MLLTAPLSCQEKETYAFDVDDPSTMYNTTTSELKFPITFPEDTPAHTVEVVLSVVCGIACNRDRPVRNRRSPP